VEFGEPVAVLDEQQIAVEGEVDVSTGTWGIAAR
jgi:hypothetical protein